jgi:Zn-dependent peptidase ImmA (M78 family)
MDKRDRYANRLRFTFAHEVGHFILHKYLYNRFSFSTIEEFFEFQRSFPEDQYSYFEYQANEFAGRLLVPRESLVTELDNLLGLVKNDPRFSRIMKSDPEIILNRLTPKLCKPFGVSEEAIKRRIQREGLWTG